MPLRAKVQNLAFSTGSPKMVSTHLPPGELPGDEPDDVLFGSIYGVRTIELNRPKKLNSLNGSMARKIIPRLQEWEKSQLANVIIMSGAGDKAFCAGGDVAALAQYNKEGPEGQAKSADYFGLEYQLDHLISTYSKPYIAYMDGITMGGGVGLSVHAPFRIATERTVFAMPETTIGFFPDVGGTFFLPRLDGFTGKYLALTSERLKGVNAFYAGVATHYIHSSSLGDLTQRLSELVFRDNSNLPERLAFVNTTIEEYSTGLPHDEPMLLAGSLRRAIDRCFAPDSIEAIVAKLEQEAAATSRATAAWASATLATLAERSPTSLKVTARQMTAFRDADIAQVFGREHQLAARFMAHPDFTEGVTARLVEKRAPTWRPATAAQVSTDDVDAMFRTQGPRLELLNDRSYLEYPHAATLGLPREADVMQALTAHEFKSEEEVVRHFLRLRSEKVGTREKVEEVLARIVKRDGNGVLRYRAWLEARAEQQRRDVVERGEEFRVERGKERVKGGKVEDGEREGGG
ncbi:MAG: hypothetical protein LQ340_000943 [Diploschistes diacapsis]|nr:MAG: hypothetical protein LQ340_000943 [Diploschistes diacapsis]